MKNFDERSRSCFVRSGSQSADDWSKPFTGAGSDAKDRFDMVLQCATHLHHHVGQMMYLAFELKNKAHDEGGDATMPQTIVEKIAQAHLAEGPNRPLRTGDFVSIRPHRVMTHDNTSAVMSKFKGIGAKKVPDPHQIVFTLDHDIQNQDESNLKKYRAIEAFAKEQGIDFYPAGSGIGHQIMVERGYVVPGSFVVASDSHSNMYGALGAIGTPIVRTDAAAVWATGEFWWQIPRSVQVVLEGKLPEGATGKDVIITLCGLYNHDEVLNAAIEFTGPGVASLSMDARLSISNMTTEWGPLVGFFPVDEVTIEYLRGVHRD